MSSPVDGLDDGIAGFGVRGRSYSRGYGVFGYSRGYGVVGLSIYHDGVIGQSYRDGVVGTGVRDGVVGLGDNYGVVGNGVRIGVYGRSRGTSDSNYGVLGSGGKYGVYGAGDKYGVSGVSGSGFGVSGESSSSVGVNGFSYIGPGVIGFSYIGPGVYGASTTGDAAWLDGNVRITGTLQKGGGSFKIDHPLDPANKYLSHSFVESPDMKNVYDGVVVLDNKGEAEIELPDWFGALNKDFRYQLTAIGAPGPNLHIAEEISDAATTNYSSSNNKNNNNSRFKIAGGTSGMKVSWQVTGIRKDPWANAHRIQVEEDKSAKEQGYYLYPDLYGKAAEKGISRLLFSPEEEERKKQELLINEQNKLT